MKKSTLGLIVASGLFSVASYAADINIGLGVSSTNTGYTNYDTQSGVVPLINIEDKNFYVRINQAGYYLFNDEVNQFSLIAEMNADKWDSSETNRFKALHDRDASINAGAQFRTKQSFGVLTALVATDASNNSNGHYGDASYAYPWQATQKLKLRPSVGVEWLSSDYADYYYGVSKQDTKRVGGLTPDNVGATTRPYVSVYGEYAINDKWTAVGSVEAKRLSDDIQDSQLVSGNTETTMMAGATYKF